MTTAQLAKWGERYGITLDDVLKLGGLIDKYAKEREHYCNGDPYPLRPHIKDKSRLSAIWDHESELTGQRIERLASSLGFTGVDFGVGLYPALAKDGDTCIMVPDLDE